MFFVYQNKQGNTVYLYGYRVPFLLQNCYYLALVWPHPHVCIDIIIIIVIIKKTDIFLYI